MAPLKKPPAVPKGQNSLLAAMQRILEDYEAGRQQRRYVASQLPRLPLPDGSFDLALCSHFPFLYGDQLSEDLHFKSIREVCRVAGKCRIFPLG